MAISFIDFEFPATDATEDRTLPDRLIDTINVKDWGATGDGSTDDTAAIQAAIDYAWAINTGNARTHGTVVFFPAGVYRIDSGPLNLHNTVSHASGSYNLSLQGVGMDVSVLRGDYAAGFMVQKLRVGFSCGANFGNISSLTIWNESQESGSGAFLLAANGTVNYYDCVHFKGFHGFWWLNNVYSHRLSNCKFTSSVPANSVASATYWPPRGSVGLMSVQGEISNCRVEGFDTGINLLGGFDKVVGNSISRCNTGVFTGLQNPLSPVNQQANGVSFASNRIARCTEGIYHHNATGCTVTSNVISGTEGPRDAAAMTLSWSGGIATATVSGGHNLQVNEVQRITVANTVEDTAASGTFTLTFGGNTTSAIAYNADAADVQAALEALASIGSGDVACTGGPFPGRIYVEFTGALARAAQSNIAASSSLTNASVAITQMRNGGLTTDLVIVTNPVNWTPDGTGTDIVTATWTSSTTFTYSLPGTPSAFVSATWNYALARAYAIRDAGASFHACNVLSALVPTDKSVDLEGATPYQNASNSSNRILVACHRAPYGWTAPNGLQAAAYNFIGCNRGVFAVAYTNLPGNALVGEGFAQVGMEYTITNGAPDSAAFGATITGTDTNRYKVRYDGTNWIRVG